MAGLMGFPLGEEMHVLRPVAQFRRAKVEPLLGFGSVANVDGRLLLRVDGRLKVYRDLMVLRVPGGDVPLGPDGFDLQVTGIEDQLVQRLEERCKGDVRDTRNAAGQEVGSDIDLGVQDIHPPLRRVLAAGLGSPCAPRQADQQ